MPDEELKDDQYIGMLLDIEHLYGEHEGRMGPILATLALIAAPILFYIYFQLYSFIPLIAFGVVEVFYSIRIVMLIPGREKYRVGLFKNQIHSNYKKTAEMMNIKTIHPDGCVEYVNGRILYLVCCFNGTTDNPTAWSIQLRKFLDSLFGEFEVDTYIHNLNDSPALRNYYRKVSSFDKNDSARNFIDIIDHTLTLTADTSVVLCTIYAIKGFRSDWKVIKNQIDTTLGSKMARCYKHVSRVDDPAVINEVIDRNIDSIVNIEDLLRHKYANQNYFTSKVLAYDLDDDQVVIQGSASIEPVIKEPPRHSFHVEYKEE